MASYCELVRTNLDAATAQKVAQSVRQDHEKTREPLALGPSSTHADLLRLLQRRYITKFISARFWAFVGPAPGPSLHRGEPALLVSQAFSGRKGVVSQDYFSHLSEFWWLRP